MEQQAKDEKALKRRRLLLFVPVFIIAFGGLFYLALHVGSPRKDEKATTDQGALNTKLPEASLQPSEKNKLEIYMQAEKDSAKWKEAERSDPYSNRLESVEPLKNENAAVPYPDEFSLKRKSLTDPNEKKVNDRLEKLYAALSDRETTIEKPRYDTEPLPGHNSPELAELEQQYQRMVATNNADTGDAEMRQIDGMLDKLLDIQYPDRVKERMQADQGKTVRSTLPVSSGPAIENTTGFYGLQSDTATETAKSQTILATVHETQTVQNGSTVKLRLLQDMYVGAKRIPAGNFVHGICTINDERVIVQLFNVNYKNDLLPIQLNVYDMDGLEGVHVPGAITRNAAKEGTSQFLQSVGTVSTVDPSLAAQAAAAGIQTATGLLSRKVTNVQATVRAGHEVLLRNKQVQ